MESGWFACLLFTIGGPKERREHYLVIAEKYGTILDALQEAEEFLQMKRIKKTT